MNADGETRSYHTVPQTSCIMYSLPWGSLYLLISVLSVVVGE